MRTLRSILTEVAISGRVSSASSTARQMARADSQYVLAWPMQQPATYHAISSTFPGGQSHAARAAFARTGAEVLSLPSLHQQSAAAAAAAAAAASSHAAGEHDAWLLKVTWLMCAAGIATGVAASFSDEMSDSIQLNRVRRHAMGAVAELERALICTTVYEGQRNEDSGSNSVSGQLAALLHSALHALQAAAGAATGSAKGTASSSSSSSSTSSSSSSASAGVPHGTGTQRWVERGSGAVRRVYTGGWCEGEMHGHGRLQREDGSVYTGPFIRGVAAGAHGHLTFPDGSSYTGGFFDDAPEGWGAAVSDSWVYEGEWKGGRWHGTGVAHWRAHSLAHANSSTATSSSSSSRSSDNSSAGAGGGGGSSWSESYEGSFAYGRRHGHGTLTFHHQHSSSSTHSHSHSHSGSGSGAQVPSWLPGDVVTLEAVWWRDAPHGLCTLTHADGRVTQQWVDKGRAVGAPTLLTPATTTTAVTVSASQQPQQQHGADAALRGRPVQGRLVSSVPAVRVHTPRPATVAAAAAAAAVAVPATAPASEPEAE